MLEAKLKAIPNIFEALQNDVEKSELFFFIDHINPVVLGSKPLGNSLVILSSQFSILSFRG